MWTHKVWRKCSTNLCSCLIVEINIKWHGFNERMQKWYVIHTAISPAKPRGSWYLIFTRKFIRFTFMLNLVIRTNRGLLILFKRHVWNTWNRGLQVPKNHWDSLFLWSGVSQSTTLTNVTAALSGLQEWTKRSADLLTINSLPSTIWSVPHSGDLPISVSHENLMKVKSLILMWKRPFIQNKLKDLV